MSLLNYLELHFKAKSHNRLLLKTLKNDKFIDIQCNLLQRLKYFIAYNDNLQFNKEDEQRDLQNLKLCICCYFKKQFSIMDKLEQIQIYDEKTKDSVIMAELCFSLIKHGIPKQICQIYEIYFEYESNNQQVEYSVQDEQD